MVFQQQETISTLSIADKFLSKDNFLQAFTNVAAKKGSPGVDGESIEDFKKNLRVNVSQLRDEVANNKYRPLPCKRAFVPKGNGELRSIGVPTVRDRIVQHALLNVLHPVVEPSFSEVSFAYRPNLSYIDAVKEVAKWRDAGYRWVLDGDITKFFDNIDHQRLLVEVRKFVEHPGILGLIQSWISAGVVAEGKVVPAEKGVPQGAVVSPLLANIYLDEFDKTLSQTDWKLVRYADDFVVLTRTFEEVVEAYSRVGAILSSMGLSLHPEKTLITNFKEGFSFLGHGFLEEAIFPLEGDVAKSDKRKGKKKPFWQKGKNQRKGKKRR
jgi:RNA-directed DNA polymerase